MDRRDLPLVEHPEPRHSPRDGPENRAVGLELGRVRSLDLLAPRDVRELHRHTDDEVATKDTPTTDNREPTTRRMDELITNSDRI